MNTPAIPSLPFPPNILRASCPDPLARKENYWSSYIWNLNNCLQFPFRNLFLDLRYGYPLFPDKTLDWGEMKYDTTNFIINIGGTDYDQSWTAAIFSITDEDPNAVFRRGSGSDAEAAWNDYDTAPSYFTAHPTPGCNFSCIHAGGGVYRAQAIKFYFKFDTSGASANPESATLTFTCNARNNTGLADPTLRLYSQDYGVAVDTGDWSSGTIVDTYLFDVGSTLEEVNVSFDVATEYVDTDGWSKFKLNFKEVDDNTHPITATGFVCQQITSVKLTLTY